MLLNSHAGARALPLMIALGLAASCKDDDGQSGDGGSGSSGTDTGSVDDSNDATTTPDASDDDPSTATQPTTDPDETTDPDTTAPDTSGDSDPDTGIPGDGIYDESFDGPDGSPWPAPWEIVGTHIIDAVLDGGRARMSGENNLTARMVLPGFDVSDVDVTVVIEYEDFTRQGYGFYVRQNGGALQETDPPGQGYGVYAEGGVLQALGIWKEINGVEMPVLEIPDAVPGGVAPLTPYAIRFQCLQNGNATTLRAKMWPEGDAEPGAWMVEVEDSTPELQNLSGSFANDVYNYAGMGPVWVHSVTIEEL